MHCDRANFLLFGGSASTMKSLRWGSWKLSTREGPLLGKTKKSLTVIHIPRSLADDLQKWREECPDSSPDAFILTNEEGGLLDTDNYRKRVLAKLARKLNLPNLTFQVIRRTVATSAQKRDG